MATAELAAALPVVAVLLVVCLAAVSLGTDQVRCIDAARSAVRLMARGESDAAVRAEAARAGPRAAMVATARSGDRVSVTVSGEVPAPLGWLGVRTRPIATAAAVREDVPGARAPVTAPPGRSP
jgi:hypothetical protein